MAAQEKTRVPLKRPSVRIEVLSAPNGGPQILLQRVLFNDEEIPVNKVGYEIAAGEIATLTLTFFPEHFEVVEV